MDRQGRYPSFAAPNVGFKVRGQARARGRGYGWENTPRCSLKAGDVVEGQVVSLARFGAFVALADGLKGLVHISELKHGYVSDVSSVVSVGEHVRVRVLEVGSGRISLSLKQTYEDAIRDGTDWGHPWGDDPSRPTRWADLGPAPETGPEAWETGAAMRRPIRRKD